MKTKNRVSERERRLKELLRADQFDLLLPTIEMLATLNVSGLSRWNTMAPLIVCERFCCRSRRTWNGSAVFNSTSNVKPIAKMITREDVKGSELARLIAVESRRGYDW